MMLNFRHDNWVQVNSLYSTSESFNSARSNCVRVDFFLPFKGLAKDSILLNSKHSASSNANPPRTDSLRVFFPYVVKRKSH